MVKTVYSAFGTMRPGARISALRPKQKRSAWSAFVLLSVGCENSAFRLRKWSAPSEQSREVLAHLRLRSVTSNVVAMLLRTSTIKQESTTRCFFVLS